MAEQTTISDALADVSPQMAAYIRAALAQAQYETLPDDGTIYGSIPGFQGVWANAPDQATCQVELAEVLADWLTLRLDWRLPVPVSEKENKNK